MLCKYPENVEHARLSREENPPTDTGPLVEVPAEDRESEEYNTEPDTRLVDNFFGPSTLHKVRCSSSSECCRKSRCPMLHEYCEHENNRDDAVEDDYHLQKCREKLATLQQYATLLAPRE